MKKPLFLLVCLFAGLLAVAQTGRLPSDSASSAGAVPVAPFRLYTLAPNGYVQSLAGVCRIEYRFQSATRLPLYLRLGSKAYVDRMERKAGLPTQ